MLPIEEVRRVDLWEKVPPDQMWERYKNGLDRMVDRLFSSSRARAFVAVKDVPGPSPMGEKA